MARTKTDTIKEWVSVIPEKIPEEVTENDAALFDAITTTQLSEEQERRLTQPGRIFERQQDVLAIHWHPEFIPMALIAKRLSAMYPDKRRALIIPTQHNVITTCGDYAGVEIDCFSRGFNQKVQLLLHLMNEGATFVSNDRPDDRKK
jgi:hypothetical protein